jgi:queuine tRNA-ribosyltransferase
MSRMIEATIPFLPADRPRYLMGVGRPLDIVGAVQRGIDMFDCVMPTRSGRTGQAFTRRGTINIRNARHAQDPRPLDGDCACPVCRDYARGYLHHLFKAEEMLGPMLLTAHNLHHYQALMAGLRGAIEAGRLDAFAAEVAANEAKGDLDPLPDPLAAPA